MTPRQRKPRTPTKAAPIAYTDIPLELFARDSAEPGMAPLWLRALDALVPATPTGLLDLLNIIGPEWILTNSRGPTARRVAEAAQNARAAQILGVNVRSVQRYRLAATPERQGDKAEVRGASARKQRELLAKLAPVARDLILRRFLALCVTHGLAGCFAGSFSVSSGPARAYDRCGGVEGDLTARPQRYHSPAEKPSSSMEAVVAAIVGDTEEAHSSVEGATGGFDVWPPVDWDAAAWQYWDEWLADWGISARIRDKNPASPAQTSNWLLQAAEMIEENVEEVESWELSLGYPSPVRTDPGGGGDGDPERWLTDELLAKYRQGRPLIGGQGFDRS